MANLAKLQPFRSKFTSCAHVICEQSAVTTLLLFHIPFSLAPSMYYNRILAQTMWRITEVDLKVTVAVLLRLTLTLGKD